MHTDTATSSDVRRAGDRAAAAAVGGAFAMASAQNAGFGQDAGHGAWGCAESRESNGARKFVMTQDRARVKLLLVGAKDQVKVWSDSRTPCSWNPMLPFSVPDMRCARRPHALLPLPSVLPPDSCRRPPAFRVA